VQENLNLLMRLKGARKERQKQKEIGEVRRQPLLWLACTALLAELGHYRYYGAAVRADLCVGP